MASFQNIVSAVDVSGGLVSAPPLSSPVLKAAEAKQGSGFTKLAGPLGTPWSQCSTAPNTPAITAAIRASPKAWLLDGESAPNTPTTQAASSPFSRQLSGGACSLGAWSLEDEQEASPKHSDTSPCARLGKTNVPVIELEPVQEATNKLEELDDEELVEKDGIMWSVARGAPPSVSQLENSLSDVKALYKAMFGHDVDVDEVEQDSITWSVTRGAPPSVSKLEDSLSDVKALYKANFGCDVDEDEVVKDGIMWSVTRGDPPSVSQLEDSLSDVKALFKAKFGQDVDAEDEVEKDSVCSILSF